MAALALKVSKITFKALLFFGLFWLSIPYIHTYPIPLPPDHQHILLVLSRKLGICDPDDFYVSAVIITNLFAATIEYKLLICLGVKTQKKWNARRRHDNSA